MATGERFTRRAFATSDGVQLSYIRQGSGRPIVLLHGWSQCAEEFKYQIEPLSARYDVIAVDQRSHGESQKVSYRLKISRLAKDLDELLTELDLNEVALLGHSMGTSVIWCYIELFGPERLSKIILVDQLPFVTSQPHRAQQELEDSGALFTAQQVFDAVAALRSKEAERVIDEMVTKHLIPRINLPTLIISEIFEEAEGGRHLMFIENPERFNRMIMKFLG